MYTYKNIECAKMTDEDIFNTSKLFSENYGKWSSVSKINPGKNISLSPARIKNDFVMKPDRYVAMVFKDSKLVGHAFYMRRTVSKNRKITWILQLVVHKEYRNNRIATRLLHSIFGLSDSFACGLYTSAPMTIKALENATFRHIEVSKITKNIELIKEASYDLLENPAWISSYDKGIVNTEFFVEHSSLDSRIMEKYPDGDFPFNKELAEGHEWLAFTFKSQEPQIENDEQLKILTEYSDDILKASYSHMKMETQAWSKNAAKEVDLIIKFVGSVNRILDLGCGQGRHSIILTERGYDVDAVDFSEENIRVAEYVNKTNLKCYCDDARFFKGKEKYDACIAMYDVVGSFPDECDNIKIVKNAFKNLKRDGVFIISVMNMNLTRNRCLKAKNVIKDISNNIDKLLKLESSNTMQKTGDIFDGKRILIDDLTGICYRKEQFYSEDYLPEEYIVRDRRYTKTANTKLMQREGFSVEVAYCFNANDISRPLNPDDKNAKEILVVARKKGKLYRLFQRIFNKTVFWQ